jgi:ribonuclease HI
MKLPALALAILSLVIISGCSSSVESDARQVVDLMSKAQNIEKETGTKADLSTLAKAAKLMQEAQELQSKFEKKYSSEKDKEAFQKALLEAMSSLK